MRNKTDVIRIRCSCGYDGSRRLRKGQISKLGRSYPIRAVDISWINEVQQADRTGG
jgi:hypothetical protein